MSIFILVIEPTVCTPLANQHIHISDRDGHNDFPWTLKRLVFDDLRRLNFSQDLTQVEPWASDVMSHTDIPRIKRGRLGGQHFATSSADIEYAIANNKTASLIAIEGGHSIQSSFAILRQLYQMGARYMTLTHSCNLPWADSSPVDAGLLPPANGGLSTFGLEVVDEMNRLGMMIDLSHVSSDTMKAAIIRSKAPVIFSHSSARTICNHHRNVPDDVLQMVRSNRGIVMVNFYSVFIQCDPTKNATMEDVIAHIEHIRTIAGVDAVGIGADYDGVDSVPIDLADVSYYPVLFEALAQRGWTDEDLEKLAGRNLLRVFLGVEQVRDLLANLPVQQDSIRREDVENANISVDCVSWPFIDDSRVAENANVLA
ncbi:dipeptidase 1-like [Folsomia candida]|uniref:dipeptidase 1-like n=1 Tax=Folsomia candida TaxID=158441 RepID=UPI00160540BA|nr:dipeptidase 1-like [Folsomia candida]